MKEDRVCVDNNLNISTMSDSELIENPTTSSTTLKRRSSLEVVSGSQGQETLDLAEQLQFEERPRIGLVWQFIWFVAFHASWVLEWHGTIYGVETYFIGVSMIPVSWACGLLFFLSDPSNKALEVFLTVNLIVAALGTVSAPIAHKLNQSSVPTLNLIGISVVAFLSFFVFWFLVSARRKIGDFSTDRLYNFVYKTVFLTGVGSLPAFIYLTSETIKCSLDYGSYRRCSGISVPQLSICTMLLLFLTARLVFVPLSSE